MKYLAFVLCSLFTSASFAEVVVYAIDIPGLHDGAGKGIYDKIINDAIVSKGHASLQVLPPTRAMKTFESCTNCCLSPANLNPEFYDFGADVVQTEPMAVAQIHIFSQPGAPVFTTLSELKGKKVGVRSGMPHGKTFDNAGLNITGTTEIANNITKLEAKRIDAMVAYIPDAYDAFTALGKEPFPHAKDAPIAVHPDSLVCRGASAEVIAAFNDYVKSKK